MLYFDNETVYSTLREVIYKGHSRSLATTSFVRSPEISTWERKISKIAKNDFEGRSRSLAMAQFNRPQCNFQLVVSSNHVPISCRFWDIQRRLMVCPWNLGWRLFKVIENSASWLFWFLRIINVLTYSCFNNVRDDRHTTAHVNAMRRT